KARTDTGVAAYKKYGTTVMVKIVNESGAFPTKYWAAGEYDQWKEISGDALLEKCKVKAKACPRCFMACGNLSEVVHGRHAGLKLEGPEYETIYAFGGLCMIDSIEEIIYLNDMCDQLGIDTITAGNLAAFAVVASEKGVIDERIGFGDVDAIAELLKKIAARRGIGTTLSEGIVHASKEWGMAEEAVHVKGLEPAGYDPRVLKGMGLAYAVSDRGACHLRSTFYKPELAGMIEPDQIKGKAEMFIDFEDRLTLFDTMVFCRFFRDLIQWDELATVVRATTGMDLDQAGLKGIAANVTDAARIFNLREGMAAEQDSLPEPFFTEKLPPSGKSISREDLHMMVQDYYRLRGWDKQGIPASYKA
ncbi:MAG: aldehyde ferredoxin oxidoreductase C-terminal domain-containing protein, partial [Candidatus Hydrogenedentota bacterium]